MALEAFLREIDRALPGGSVVRDAELRAGYGADESEAAPVVPEAVIRVASSGEVAAVLRAASAHRVPVTPRGGGTGRVGGAVPAAGGVVLSLERMDGLRGIEPRDGYAVVGPGMITGDLHAVVEAEGLFYAPDPNSAARCTLGGNVATNAGGPRAFAYGVTREHVLGLELVTAQGEVVRVGRRTRKGVTGYDLTALVVGSEGTLAVVTEVTVRLLRRPQALAMLVAFVRDEASVGRAIDALVAGGVQARCAELLDREALEIVRQQAGLPTPAGAGALLITELDGDEDRVERALERAGGLLDDAGALEVLVARSAADRERLWAPRRELSRSLRRLARHKLSEDVVVPRSRLGALLARCHQISAETGVRMATYGHAGDGNLHVNLLWNDARERPAVERAIGALFEATIALGGCLSGEHGIGLLKAPYLALELSPATVALSERVKDAFDPQGILNPGKIFSGDARRPHGAC